MPLDRLIEQHKKQVRAARSSEVIFDVTLDAIRELGFNRLAIVHAFWFTQPGRRLLFLHNFDEWGALFVTRPYLDRKSVVEGQSVSVRVDLGGRGLIKTKKETKRHYNK